MVFARSRCAPIAFAAASALIGRRAPSGWLGQRRQADIRRAYPGTLHWCSSTGPSRQPRTWGETSPRAHPDSAERWGDRCPMDSPKHALDRPALDASARADFSSKTTSRGHGHRTHWAFLAPRSDRGTPLSGPGCADQDMGDTLGETGPLLAATRGVTAAWSDVQLSAPEPVPPVFHWLLLRRLRCERQGERWQEASDSWSAHRCHRRPSCDPRPLNRVSVRRWLQVTNRRRPG